MAWNNRHRLLARWVLASGVVALIITGWVVTQGTPREGPSIPGAKVVGVTSMLSEEESPDGSPIRLVDVTLLSGIRFHHFPVKRRSLLPEDMGSGVAAGDYDGDGLTDLYFVNFSGNILGKDTDLDRNHSARLYRNLGNGTFEDVTEMTGVGFVGFGMGAAWGDYDNDGDLDLYVTAYGANVMYENRGSAGFLDVTKHSGLQDTRFSTGVSWADYDRDGDLDLYVCNYVDFQFRKENLTRLALQYDTKQPYTLNPSSYKPQPNALFRNLGDGSFEEVAEIAGIANPQGRSLSASWVDMDNDGWPDLYVANDVSSNGVFRNTGDGKFEDVGARSLAADYRGAMGIAVADFDNDLDLDLLITHWIAQENALFCNMLIDPLLDQSDDAHLWFMDVADEFGLGQISLDTVGWGTGFTDFDNDGLRDIWLVNGGTLQTRDDPTLLEPQKPMLFWNRGEGGYSNVAPQAFATFNRAFVARGGAQLDFDADGRVDLVWVVHGGTAILLRNDTPNPGHWLRVNLRQDGGNTYAIGGRVYVTTGGQTQMAEVGSSASYLSQDELTLHFGLAEASSVELLRVVWPDGSVDEHRGVAVDQLLPLTHAAHYPAVTGRP